MAEYVKVDLKNAPKAADKGEVKAGGVFGQSKAI